MTECKHEEFEAKVAVNRFEHTGRFAADISIHCVACNEWFRFIGVPGGISWEHPAASIDGLELRCPIEPEGDKKFLVHSTYEMPPEVN